MGPCGDKDPLVTRDGNNSEKINDVLGGWNIYYGSLSHVPEMADTSGDKEGKVQSIGR